MRDVEIADSKCLVVVVVQETRFERTEIRMVRWMRGVSLREKKTIEKKRRQIERGMTIKRERVCMLVVVVHLCHHSVIFDVFSSSCSAFMSSFSYLLRVL